MAKGIVRRLDELGRITIPAEMRETLRIGAQDTWDIYLDNEVICIEPYKEGSREKQYKVERYINGRWFYEGTGPVAYVNKMIKRFSPSGALIRIVDAAE